MKLTPKQQAFADYYIETGNASESARRAGYKKPYVQGAENFQKPRIKAYIDKRLKKIESDRIMNADEALQLLTEIARGKQVETVVTASGKEVERKADINQRLKVLDSIMKRFDVVASLGKTEAETEFIREKTKLLKGASKDTSLL